MPWMDGIEATRRIKAECPTIQIVGLSTSPPSQKRHAIELAGATSFFTKGVETQRLIEHLLRLHAAMAIGSAD
jgi:CheY-like chemotaxis protein